MSASSSSSCSKPGEMPDDSRRDFDGELPTSDAACQQKGLTSLRRGSSIVKENLSARKIHKADREKLRRDRLNEQLSEIAGALEPNRPKNDKYTILADTIQALKDLMNKVERLRTEHTLLSDESHELSQEKEDLEEEKSQLNTGLQQLQSQIQQQMHALSLWMGIDRGAVAGPSPSVYPAIRPPHDNSPGYNHQHQSAVAQGQMQVPRLPAQPGAFVPMSVLQRPVAMQPGLGTCTQFFPCNFNYSHQAEDPGIQSVPGYPFQIYPTPPADQIYTPTFSFVQSANENHHALPKMAADVASSEEHEENPHSRSSITHTSDDEQNVPTVLQLRTPNVIYQSNQPK